jgi:hypothetical protein
MKVYKFLWAFRKESQIPFRRCSKGQRDLVGAFSRAQPDATVHINKGFIRSPICPAYFGLLKYAGVLLIAQVLEVESEQRWLVSEKFGQLFHPVLSLLGDPGVVVEKFLGL